MYASAYEKSLELLFYSHNGPVWQVAWAHPKYGHILASCSYDGKVLIWKEQTQGQGQGGGFNGWEKIKEHSLHSASGALSVEACPPLWYQCPCRSSELGELGFA